MLFRSGNHGAYDAWVTKLNNNGSIQWSKCFGGSDEEALISMKEDLNGNYVLVGGAASNDGDVIGQHGGQDLWILKLDTSGTILSQKCLGGSDFDVAVSIDNTSDGGFVLAGFTYSQNGDVTGVHGLSDYWILKLN